MKSEIRLYDGEGIKFFAKVDLNRFLASVQKSVKEAIVENRNGCHLNAIISQAISDATGNVDESGQEFIYATMEIAPKTPQTF